MFSLFVTDFFRFLWVSVEGSAFFNEDVNHFFIDDCVLMMISVKFVISTVLMKTIEMVKMWRG